MKKLLLPIILLYSVFSFSQKKERRAGEYSVYLSSVEAPKAITSSALDTVLSTYEDSIMKIVWVYSGSFLGFIVTNRSGETFKIIWDDAAYIDLGNQSLRIFHTGVSYIDRDKPQPPTSVYKNTTLEELIAPASYTTFEPGQFTGGWKSRPLIPIAPGVFSSKVEYNERLIGQILRVVLPIKMDERVLEYMFSFKIKFIQKGTN